MGRDAMTRARDCGRAGWFLFKHAFGLGVTLAGAGLSSGVARGQVVFTHDVGSGGAPGTGVMLTPDPAALFDGFGGTNLLAAPAASLGLVPGDQIDAFDRDGYSPVFVGQLVTPFLFSVEPGAVGQPGRPVNLEAPNNPGDQYALGTVPGHTLAAQEADVGLLPNGVDSIDGMAERPVAFGERVFFSLRSGSPTLVGNGWSGADVLTAVVGVPGSLGLAMSHTQLGLLAGDDLDALAVEYPLDADGDGNFFGPSDTANVYLSVTPGSSGAPGTGVSARSGAPGAGGDIFFSGLAGGNTLLYAGDRWIKLAPGDVVDAIRRGSIDPADPFPLMSGSLPPVPPMQPPNEPPYRGIGVPIGEVYVQVCDTALAGTTNWSLTLKLCDQFGNTMDVSSEGSIKGLGGARGLQKAVLIASVFAAAALDKPGNDPDPLPIFSSVVINIPSQNVNHPNIVAEVCAVVNQDLVDCGWDLDAVCFSMTNWTAGIILEELLGAFDGASRLTTYWVADTPKLPGVFGISAGDLSDPDNPMPVRYEAPFLPGEDPFFIGSRLADAINDEGGVAALSPDGRVTVVSLPVEPPPTTTGLAGPFVWEGGALDAGVVVGMDAQLSRLPGAPCSAADLVEPFGEVSIFDLLELLSRFTEGDPRADYAEPAGVVNIFDILAYLDLWTEGCPIG